MPTGYTIKIEDDENYTFREFLLKCATAFGACFHQRDSYRETPILNKVDLYYETQLNLAKEELKYWQNISDEELATVYNQHIDDNFKYNTETRNKQDQINKNYKNMLEQVEKWTPPSSEHENLKQFMKDQIILCYNPNYIPYIQEIMPSAIYYKQYNIKHMEDNIKYYSEEHEKECARVENNNQWIRQLIESL